MRRLRLLLVESLSLSCTLGSGTAKLGNWGEGTFPAFQALSCPNRLDRSEIRASSFCWSLQAPTAASTRLKSRSVARL